MTTTEAAAILQALATLSEPQTRQAIAVVLQAAGLDAPAPEPEAVAHRHPVAFVGYFELPEQFWLSADGASWMPCAPMNTALSWNRLLAFGGPGMLRPIEGETWLARFVGALLPGRWQVLPIEDEDTVVLQRNQDISLTFPARSDQLQVIDLDGQRHWDFRRGVSLYSVLSVIAHAASAVDIAPSADVALEGGEKSLVEPERFHGALKPLSTTLNSIDDWSTWTTNIAAQIRWVSGRRLLRGDPATDWSEMSADEQEMWTFWVRNHPGMLRLELALRDFFTGGGQQAMVALSLAPTTLPRDLAAPLAAICAPGLGADWQEAISEWGESTGTPAIVEEPRFSQHSPPAGVHLDGRGWTVSADYEAHPAICAPNAPVAPWRVVENPLSQGDYDQHRCAPPSGYHAAKG